MANETPGKVQAWFLDQITPHFPPPRLGGDKGRWLGEWENQFGSLKIEDLDILAKHFIRHHKGSFPRIADVLDAVPKVIQHKRKADGHVSNDAKRVAEAYWAFMDGYADRLKAVVEKGHGWRLRADLRHHERDGRMEGALANLETLPADPEPIRARGLTLYPWSWRDFLDSLPARP